MLLTDIDCASSRWRWIMPSERSSNCVDDVANPVDT